MFIMCRLEQRFLDYQYDLRVKVQGQIYSISVIRPVAFDFGTLIAFGM